MIYLGENLVFWFWLFQAKFWINFAGKIIFGLEFEFLPKDLEFLRGFFLKKAALPSQCIYKFAS